MARVEFERVEKTFPGGVRALADCSLRIADAELLVVVGPSGCGKSTVLRLIAGLERPTAGRLSIDGRVVNDVRSQDRNVAMVFQDYALYPYLSARNNLEFPLRMRRLPRPERRRRVEQIAELLAITPLLERLPKQLSGGERQRVAMGRALVREPAVFLLDEPLSNLDAKLRVQVRAEIKDLQRRTATTMVYVTHDQVEAMTLGDRVAVLREGRLQQVAAPRDLYDRPANAFVAGFIGNPPMNLFPSRLIPGKRRDGLVLQLGGQTVPIAPTGAAEERLRAHLDVPLTAGVRPEALRVYPASPAQDAAGGDRAGARATVEHVECLGHETLVHLRVDAGDDGAPAGSSAARVETAHPDAVPLVARIDGLPGLAKGDAVRVELDPARVYLFAADGRALNEPRE
jgi:ABC-type sugar transport system ATPase subunit